MVNTELVEKIYEFIKANPERHNQANWATESESECGTQACIAGWAAIIGLNIPLRVNEEEVCDCGCGATYGPTYSYEEPAAGWHAAAQKQLGISENLANALFRGTNRRDLTVEAVRMLADGADEIDIIDHLRVGCSCGYCDGSGE